HPVAPDDVRRLLRHVDGEPHRLLRPRARHDGDRRPEGHGLVRVPLPEHVRHAPPLPGDDEGAQRAGRPHGLHHPRQRGRRRALPAEGHLMTADESLAKKVEEKKEAELAEEVATEEEMKESPAEKKEALGQGDIPASPYAGDATGEKKKKKK